MRSVLGLLLALVLANLVPDGSLAAAKTAQGCQGCGTSMVSEDDVRCIRYAAERGDAYAQNNLGFMYASGEGVPQDFAEAYKWWAVAAMNGIEAARDNMKKIREKMTSSQLEQVQLAAMECFMKTVM